MKEPSSFDAGVIVGRFQVPKLHEGHKKLINHVVERHGKVIIVLGVSLDINTTNNPLDFEARRQMIQEDYPFINVLYIPDVGDDKFWSEQLDILISHVLSPNQKAVLYGSRDSFIDVYNGKYQTFELLQDNYMSGTEVRQQVRQTCIPTEDFRSGVIWASANRFPTVYTCVDIAVFNEDETALVLARKEHDPAWRLPGGFADVNSMSFEEDAYRELKEETRMGVLYPIEYLGSFKVEDWRYAKEPDEIKTLLYKGYSNDKPKPCDDIKWAQWFDVSDVESKLDQLIIPDHQPLVRRALDSYDD